MSRFTLTVQDSIGVWAWHDKPLNLLSPAALEELEPFIQKLEAARLSSLIFLSGSEGGFHAGADLKAIQNTRQRQQEFSFFVSKAQSLYQRISQLPAFKIAAINGACLGGGLELALLFDFRLASLEKDTRFALPEVRLGLMPALGALHRLPRLTGIEASLKLLLKGSALAVEEARRLGLVDEAVPLSMLQTRALEVAKEALVYPRPRNQRPRREAASPLFSLKAALSRPFALRAAARQIKRKFKGLYPAPPAILKALKRGLRAASWEQVMERERKEFLKLLQSNESQNLTELFFMMKAADQKARLAAMAFAAKSPKNSSPQGAVSQERPRSLSISPAAAAAPDSAEKAASEKLAAAPLPLKSAEIQTAAIAGAGAMGAALARLFAEKGLQVHLMDKDPQALSRAMRAADRIWAGREKSGAMSARERRALLLRISPCMDLRSFRSADLAIEAAFEDLSLKRKLAQDISLAVKDEALLAALTSSFAVADIMRDVSHPQRALGLHFFNPPGSMPLVEVAVAKKTDSSVLGRAFAFIRRLGKTAAAAPDSPGLIVNRLLAKYLAKALRLLTEGHSPEVLDDIFSSFGFPKGPFHLMDEIGLDICLQSAASLQRAGIGLDLPKEALSLDQALGRGRKEGRGFYLYHEPHSEAPSIAAAPAKDRFFPFSSKRGRRLALNPKLQEVFPRLMAAQDKPISAEEAIEKCLHPLIYEASRLPRLFSPLDGKDIDLAMILGAGWPPGRGGPIAYGKAEGLI